MELKNPIVTKHPFSKNFQDDLLHWLEEHAIHDENEFFLCPNINPPGLSVYKLFQGLIFSRSVFKLLFKSTVKSIQK